MAALLSITVKDPADVLQAYGASAVVQVYRGSTDDVDDASSVTTVAVVAGTTAYEYADLTAEPGTHRYFIRYAKSTVNSTDDVSGWTGPLLAGALAGGPLTVELVRTWGKVPSADTDDDGWRPLAVAAINRAGINACGIDLGPSPDTTRQYDASEVKRDGTRLYIPGGIRTFLTVATGDGTTWTTITDSVRVGPLAHSRPTGEPGSYIEVIPSASVYLDASYFVRITATAFEGFGWAEWPDDLVQDALSAFQRLMKDRDGQGAYPTETSARRYLMLPLWHSYRDRYFPRVR